MTKLLEKLQAIFQQRFNKAPDLLVQAPGRINLIGEHTDYNLGFVLPAAVDKYICFAFAKNNTLEQCRIYAADFDAYFEFKLSEIAPSQEVWHNYIMGMTQAFLEKGASLQGFDLVMAGNIPIGAGLSSSAALECGLGMGLSTLFDFPVDKWDIPKMAKHSSNTFVGAQCGILDQFASTFGKKDQAMKLDCRSNEFEYLPLNLSPYQIVLINTKVKHEHTSSGYNDLPAACQEAVRRLQATYPKLESLRDLSWPMLKASDHLLTDDLYRRCLFILEENERVHQFCKAMQNNDLPKMGKLLYDSHYGLQHQYKVSCKELDDLVDIAKSMDGVIGSRMMGGGFGGCTINLIHADNAEAIVAQMLHQYTKLNDVEGEAYFVKIEDGVSVIRDLP